MHTAIDPSFIIFFKRNEIVLVIHKTLISPIRVDEWCLGTYVIQEIPVLPQRRSGQLSDIGLAEEKVIYNHQPITYPLQNLQPSYHIHGAFYWPHPSGSFVHHFQCHYYDVATIVSANDYCSSYLPYQADPIVTRYRWAQLVCTAEPWRAMCRILGRGLYRYHCWETLQGADSLRESLPLFTKGKSQSNPYVVEVY